MTSSKDRVYAAPMTQVPAFEFDGAVADVFQDMIHRSVPGYHLLLDLIGVVARRYAAPGTNCYDLGCSLGAAMVALGRQAPADCHLIGIDNSPAMVTRCRANLEREALRPSCEVQQQDIREVEIENASVVLLNFTLQFVPDAARPGLLANICAGLNEGGALLLGEKLRFDDAEREALLTELHHEFKRLHGYSDLEIAQKRTALERVLVPNTVPEHVARLREAGFSRVEVCAQALNFAGILAIK